MMVKCIAKLGGSLLDQPDGISRFRRWADNQSGRCSHILVVVGGGKLIDSMRDLDQMYRLDLEEMHWRCVRLLDATFEIAAELLHEATPLETLEACKAWIKEPSPLSLASLPSPRPRMGLVRVAGFYSPHRSPQVPIELLPHDWRTTTDALAIYLGILLDISEIGLLKSCAIEPGWSLSIASQQKVIDEATPKIAQAHSVKISIETI